MGLFSRLIRSRPARAMVLAAAILLPGGLASAATLIRDAEIERTLRLMARPVFEAAGLDPASVTVLILLDNSLNAFVAGGRTMVLNTGLLRRFDTPAPLIGVIAHETGHITGGHIARRSVVMQQMRGPALIAAALAAAAAAATGNAQAGIAASMAGSTALQRSLMAFSRAEEAAADQAGVSYLDRAGLDPSGMLEVLRLFQGQEVFQSRRLAPWAQTHPLSAERIALLERRIAASTAAGRPMPPDMVYRYDRMRAKLDGFIDPPERTLARVEAADEPEGELSLYRRSIALHRLGRVDAALAVLDRLQQMRPQDPDYYALRGQILFEGGRPQPAAEAYRRALALAPGEALIAGNLGRALLAIGGSGNEAEALRVLEQAVRADAADPATLRDLAIAHARAGNEGQAALATAERLALLGDFADAARLARRARDLLPAGSPGWIRADDLLALSEISAD